MPQAKAQLKKWTLVSVALTDAYTDFILSRQAMNCTEATLQFYRFTAGKFLQWIEEQGVTDPQEVTARHVRAFLARLIDAGRKDMTVYDHARAVRTLLRFWHKEGYLPQLIRFDMPRLEKKRLPVLTAEQVSQILKFCNVRDKAIILFLVDSGLRRSEVIRLNWSDVDMQSGLVRVRQGKGKKDRSAVIGARTRRALLGYRRTFKDSKLESLPLFQTSQGGRFASDGFRQIFQRLTTRSGIYVTAHALRRTFAILSIRAGMDVLHLQALGGWASLDMVQHYAQMVDEDLLREHQAHSPVDRL